MIDLDKVINLLSSKFEILNPKFQTISNDQNPNDQNKIPSPLVWEGRPARQPAYRSLGAGMILGAGGGEEDFHFFNFGFV